MIKPEKIANSTSGDIKQSHTFDLPPCCPVSKNPQPGSKLTIEYVPDGYSLDVIPLYAYIYAFRGGLRDDEGNIIVRDMEGMIKRIKDDCREVLGLPVEVYADLNIVPKQKVIMRSL